MNDLLIVGGGPAALSAAIYALGKQLDFYVIYEVAGGKAGARQRLVGQIHDEYLAGEEAARGFEQRIRASERAIHDRVTQITKADDGFHVVTHHHGVLTASAVIVATGATPVELTVPGAKEFLGWGLGYSVTTHAHLLAGKTTAIIGNTLRALRGAAELVQTADHLYFIAPDPTILSLPLANALQHQPNVEILVGAHVKEIAGSMSVEEIVVEQDGITRRLPVDAAFIDLGLHANSGIVRQLLELNPGQFIHVERNETAVPGLFAAGDVTTVFGEQTLIAIGEGAKAALSAYDYLLAQKTRVLQIG